MQSERVDDRRHAFAFPRRRRATGAPGRGAARPPTPTVPSPLIPARPRQFLSAPFGGEVMRLRARRAAAAVLWLAGALRPAAPLPLGGRPPAAGVPTAAVAAATTAAAVAAPTAHRDGVVESAECTEPDLSASHSAGLGDVEAGRWEEEGGAGAAERAREREAHAAAARAAVDAVLADGRIGALELLGAVEDSLRPAERAAQSKGVEGRL